MSFALYHFLAEPYPVDPPAKETMTDDLYHKRAAEIFDENRDDYQIGPAPRTYCVEFKHDTGRTFRLAFSEFMPTEDVANILDSIGNACKEGGVDKLRMALSLAQAVTDYDDAAHALSPEGDA